MSKQEAIEAMVRGQKVRHRYFSDNEWVTMQDGRLLFEDGVRCSVTMFWSDRKDVQWETDWELFEPPLTI